jgi:hypothetical protein
MSRRKLTDTENINFVERLVEACGTSKPAKMARLLDVSYQAAKNYLNGRLPDSNVLKTISERTPYSIHWLVTGEGKKFVENGQNKDRETLTDEMRALVRNECMDIINELLGESQKAVSPKVVVLSSDKIKQEKIVDDSVSLPVKSL